MCHEQQEEEEEEEEGGVKVHKLKSVLSEETD